MTDVALVELEGVVFETRDARRRVCVRRSSRRRSIAAFDADSVLGLPPRAAAIVALAAARGAGRRRPHRSRRAVGRASVLRRGSRSAPRAATGRARVSRARRRVRRALGAVTRASARGRRDAACVSPGSIMRSRSSCAADDVLDPKPSSEGYRSRSSGSRDCGRSTAAACWRSRMPASGIAAARAQWVRCVAVGRCARRTSRWKPTRSSVARGPDARRARRCSRDLDRSASSDEPDVHARPTARRGGQTTEIGGQHVVLTYADVREEYDALRSERDRRRSQPSRPHAILRREIGGGAHRIGDERRHVAATWTRPVRRRADREGKNRRRRAHLRRATARISSTPRRARSRGGWRWCKKYVNPRVAGYRDESYPMRDIGVFGPDARRIVAELTGVHAPALTDLPPYATRAARRSASAPVLVARAPDIGVEGFDLFVPFEIFDDVWHAAVGGGRVAGRTRRVGDRARRSRPARVGHRHRRHRRFRRKRTSTSSTRSRTRRAATSDRKSWRACTSAATSTAICADCAPRASMVRRRARSSSTKRAHTSATCEARSSSPRLGGIALGMVRREVTPGTSVTAKWETGERRVDVSALPFPT